MFTGIVEELAQIKSIKPRKKGIRYSISADFVMDDIKIGDSISVNGVCLTIVETKKRYFCIPVARVPFSPYSFRQTYFVRNI